MYCLQAGDEAASGDEEEEAADEFDDEEVSQAESTKWSIADDFYNDAGECRLRQQLLRRRRRRRGRRAGWRRRRRRHLRLMIPPRGPQEPLQSRSLGSVYRVYAVIDWLTVLVV